MPARLRRGDDAPRQLGGIRVRLAGRIVMDVVELADRRVARLRHLDVRLRGDRLERVGVDAIEERVHRLPPGPEAVVASRRPARCAPRARAGTRASAGSASPARAGPRARPRRRAAVPAATLDDRAVVVDVERHVARPAVRQQRARRATVSVVTSARRSGVRIERPRRCATACRRERVHVHAPRCGAIGRVDQQRAPACSRSGACPGSRHSHAPAAA